MNESSESAIDQHLIAQRTFFNSHQTKSKTFRMQQLKKLKDVILDYEERITDALWKDLRKSPEEAYLTEISMVLNEIKFHRRSLKQWMKPEKVPTPLHLQPSKSSVHYEPLGVALIVSPWNYPFQLLINPLVGAISAGCCAILKPSPHAPNSAKVIEEMIAECFASDYITVVQGGKETNTILFQKKFDFIFFTGSPKLGSIV
ncbi:MAG TPA: aldehyde dehydrogenase family protein, partial [Flavobacteriaceae bacterium]|nr:aldehyde dehydrogenase family protein [Flavobacteriaceae bacterium]